jgi:hypothetical protein
MLMVWTPPGVSMGEAGVLSLSSRRIEVSWIELGQRFANRNISRAGPELIRFRCEAASIIIIRSAQPCNSLYLCPEAANGFCFNCCIPRILYALRRCGLELVYCYIAAQHD